MHPVSLTRQRHIEPVVDQDSRPAGTGNGDCRSGKIGQLTGSKVFFTDLDQLTTGAGSPLDRLQLAVTTRGWPRRSFTGTRMLTGTGPAAEALSIGDQIDQSRLVGKNDPLSPGDLHWSLVEGGQIGKIGQVGPDGSIGRVFD